MLLADLVATSAAVAATRSRLAKVAALADCLRRAAPGEIAIVTSYLSGELRQRRTGVGWASLRDLPAPAAEPSLEVAEVDRAFARIEAARGRGIGRCPPRAARNAVRARHGRGAALPRDARRRRAAPGRARRASSPTRSPPQPASPAPAVRRAAMLAGDLPAVAEAALTAGEAGLGAFHLEVGRPGAADAREDRAVAGGGARPGRARAAVEWKLDGVRIQVHRDGDDVAIFTRTLDPVGERMPEIAEAVRALPLRSVILDGEAIALRPDGRPRPFQETASRAASRGDTAALRAAVPLTPFFFDVLHLDGRDLLDLPASERLAAIEPVLPAGAWVPRIVTADEAEATAFSDDALARGHEGVVVKSLEAPYEAGRRGAGWLKVKPVHTLDLVVLAAEWGHGRRQGLLSNLHLGARDAESGGYVMLGKTFKGLTDELLAWQTARLLELESRRTASTVYVHPALVVEIAFDGIQTSPRYPGGVALRFARVVRYRPDKQPAEADTIATVRMLHEARVG